MPSVGCPAPLGAGLQNKAIETLPAGSRAGLVSAGSKRASASPACPALEDTWGSLRSPLESARDPYLRGLAVGMAGGLVTYGVHGLVNNYMSYDKGAVPVWAAIGVLGAIDTLQRQ